MEKIDNTKYKNNFNKEHYDSLNIKIPKGQKTVITEHYKTQGYKSMNEYVNSLIREDMQGKP